MLLSVCIPTYNRCAYIRLSAQYWTEQMAPYLDRVELIIADNASPDDTVAILKSTLPPGSFRLIERPKNLGFNLSTHDLVNQQAQGEFIWVCGDDDYLNPGAFARVMEAIEGHRDQDHFYVTTRFVPNDHPPDLTREDPRESIYIHQPKGDSSSGLVPQTMDILATDGSGFGGFYSSIWRRGLAMEALSGAFFTQAPFTTLEATLPYSFYVARHRLREPCFRIGGAILTVVHTVCWEQYASFFRLKTMPDLYDEFIQNGAPKALVRAHQLDLLDHWPRAVVDLFRRYGFHSPKQFSYFCFMIAHIWKSKFWRELVRYLWCDLLP